jgi:predicted AlkP superfamily pyrophosphatase or phosphodiesterase
MVRRLLATAALAALGGAAPAAAAEPLDDRRTPLVYVFSLDGLDGDRVDAGRAPYLSRLLAGQEGARATYYRESRGVMVSETNPNHVAMATGAYADRSGIPGNSFAVFSAAAKARCDDEPGTGAAPGPTDPETGSAPLETDGTEPGCMIAESLFAAAERQAGAAVTTAGIFGKPKLASIFATRRVDGRTYDADHLWTPCRPSGSGNPDYCRGLGREPDGYALTDDQVMDEVLRTVDEGVAADGRRKRPNLTFVNFPTIDSVGHATGAEAAYDAAIAQMDAELREFVEHQKARGLWERTVVLAVSDHAMTTTRTSLPTQYAQALELDPLTRGRLLVVNNGSADHVYLRDRTAPQATQDAILQRARAIALTSPLLAGNVDEALYRRANALDGGDATTLTRVHPAWRLAGPRSGDLVVTAREGTAFDEGAVALSGNHGSPFQTDTLFAVIGGGTRVRQQAIDGIRGERFDDTLANPGQAENVDVAPTVMALLGRRAPADSAGRVLTEALATTAGKKPRR